MVNQRSPDWLVFLADAEIDEVNELYAAPDDASSSPTKISAYSEQLAVYQYLVSPDGEWVAFTARVDTDENGTFDNEDGPVELYRAASDGSTPAEKISGTINTYTYIDGIAWSPLSNQLVFRADVDTDDVREIYLVDNDSSTPVKINGSVSGVVEMGDTHWSPDGRYIAQFVLNKTRRYISDRQGINVYDTTLGTPNSTRMTGDLFPGSTYSQASGWSGANVSHLSWAPDSSRIVYMLDDHRTGNERTYHQAFPDGTHENVTGPLAATENGWLLYKWSPNSRYLAYAISTSGVGANIIEIFDSVDESNHRVVTIPNGGTLQDLYWRPDSNEFMLRMSLSDTDPLYELFLFDVTDEDIVNPTPLFNLDDGMSINGVTWSGDGSRFAFLLDDSNLSTCNAYSMNPDIDPDPIKLSVDMPTCGQADFISWLPNNSQLMFGHYSEGHFVTEADQTMLAVNVSNTVDASIEFYTNSFRAVGATSPHLRQLSETTVAFLGNSTESNTVSLFTVYRDGTMLREISGLTIPEGAVSSFAYGKSGG